MFDKLLRHLEITRKSAREVSVHFLEKISTETGIKVIDFLKRFNKGDASYNN